MKCYEWNTLFKKEAFAACACSQKASKAVCMRAISLRIANEFKVDVASYENIMEENLVEIMKLRWCKCNCMRCCKIASNAHNVVEHLTFALQNCVQCSDASTNEKSSR